MRFKEKAAPIFGGFSAYTLPEVLVSAGILGIMVVSLFAGFSSGFSMLRLSRDGTRAGQILRDKIEMIRLCSWDQLPNFPTSFVESYDGGVVSSNFQGQLFYGTVALGPLDISKSYQTNMQMVTVTVAWTNFNGGKPIIHSQQLQTQVARFGAQNFLWGAGK